MMLRALIELIWVNDLSIQKVLNDDEWISNYFPLMIFKRNYKFGAKCIFYYNVEVSYFANRSALWKVYRRPASSDLDVGVDVEDCINVRVEVDKILILVLILKPYFQLVTWVTLWWRTINWTSLCRRKTSSRIFSLEYLNSSISSRQHPHLLLPSQRKLVPPPQGHWPFHHPLSKWSSCCCPRWSWSCRRWSCCCSRCAWSCLRWSWSCRRWSWSV